MAKYLDIKISDMGKVDVTVGTTYTSNSFIWTKETTPEEVFDILKKEVFTKDFILVSLGRHRFQVDLPISDGTTISDTFEIKMYDTSIHIESERFSNGWYIEHRQSFNNVKCLKRLLYSMRDLFVEKRLRDELGTDIRIGKNNYQYLDGDFIIWIPSIRRQMAINYRDGLIRVLGYVGETEYGHEYGENIEQIEEEIKELQRRLEVLKKTKDILENTKGLLENGQETTP